MTSHEDVSKRKAKKILRGMENQRQKKKIQNMHTTLRHMDQVVNKEKPMMDCSRAILQHQVELLQFTISEV